MLWKVFKTLISDTIDRKYMAVNKTDIYRVIRYITFPSRHHWHIAWCTYDVISYRMWRHQQSEWDPKSRCKDRLFTVSYGWYYLMFSRNRTMYVLSRALSRCGHGSVILVFIYLRNSGNKRQKQFANPVHTFSPIYFMRINVYDKSPMYTTLCQFKKDMPLFECD